MALAYTSTRILTNHESLAGPLSTTCTGGHRHVQLVGKHLCSKAARYPEGLCHAGMAGIEIIKKSELEEKLALESLLSESHDRWGDQAIHSFADALVGIAFGDICEKGPTVWEEVADQ